MNPRVAAVVRPDMKFLLLLWATLVWLPAGAQPLPLDAFEHNRRLGGGVNILGYDPLWRARDQGRFQAKHFRLLKGAGFQTVRMNLHAFGHMDRTNRWALRPTWFETLDWAVAQATAQGLQVILDLHEFQNQGASWAGLKDKRGVTWGNDAEKQAVRDDFAKVTAWAREHNRPIFLGEFGAYDQGPVESRVRYTDFVRRAAEGSGWSWAYWQFDSDFILWDMARDAWVEPILHALIQPKQ